MNIASNDEDNKENCDVLRKIKREADTIDYDEEPSTKHSKYLDTSNGTGAHEQNMDVKFGSHITLNPIESIKSISVEEKGNSEKPATSSAGLTKQHFLTNYRRKFFTLKNYSVALIDKSCYSGIIEQSKMLLVEEKILRDISTKNPTEEDIDFNGNYWYYGFKIICCRSLKAVNFLKKIVNDLDDLWPNASLDVIPKYCLNINTNMQVYVPPPHSIDDQKMLKIMAIQNKNLKVDLWKILLCEPVKNGRLYTIGVDRASLAVLKRKKYIKFGINMLKTSIANTNYTLPRNYSYCKH